MERALVETTDSLGLDVRHVSHAAGPSRVPVLDDLSFTLNEGEFFAVLGPSGCGKSTLLDLIAGFDRPCHGEIRHRGALVDGPSAARGYVFQKPVLFPWLSVIDNVLFGPRMTGHLDGAVAAARALLEEVDLSDVADRRPHELSYGMQHRVALARALINRPSLLLMDEPFSALDAQTRAEMHELLLRIRQEHRCTIVFVTHDIEESLLLADRIAVLSRRPARILVIVDVDLPRPRDYEMIMTPSFGQQRAALRRLLHSR
jgi:NitT/TauT family transport system ATP-binding protein